MKKYVNLFVFVCIVITLNLIVIMPTKATEVNSNTENKEITEVSIYEYPNCMEITRGYSYNHSGLALKVVYSDESELIIRNGFDVSVDVDQVGSVPVKITYEEFNLSYNIKINDFPKEQEIIEGVEKTVRNFDVIYFVPEISGTYKLYTEGLSDSNFSLYRFYTIYDADNSNCGAEKNEELICYLEKGKVYRIDILIYNILNSEEFTTFKIDFLQEEKLSKVYFMNWPYLKAIEDDDSLKLTYRPEGLEQNQEIKYGVSPGILEKAVNGKWVNIPVKADATWPEEERVAYGRKDFYFYLPLKSYYGYLEEGEYRYTHTDGGRFESTEFDIINYDYDISDFNTEKILNVDNNRVYLDDPTDQMFFYFKAEETGIYTFHNKTSFGVNKKLMSLNGDGIDVHYEINEKNEFKFWVKLEKNQECMLRYEPISFGSLVYTDIDIELHKYLIKYPNCLSGGYEIFKCALCEHSYRGKNIEAKNHNFTIDDSKDLNFIIHKCSICDYEYKENKIVSNETDKKVNKVVNNVNTKFTKITRKKKIIILKWKKRKKISGYQIQLSVNKKFNKKRSKYINKNTTKIKFTKIRNNKVYYVRIRTYKIYKGKKVYSKWSKVKRIKVRKS